MECNIHPGTEAVTTCVICGSPICPMCASESNQIHLCIPHYRQKVEEIAAQLSPEAGKLAEERRKTEAKAVKLPKEKKEKKGRKGAEAVVPMPLQAQAVFGADTGTSLWEREAGEERAAVVTPAPPAAPVAGPVPAAPYETAAPPVVPPPVAAPPAYDTGAEMRPPAAPLFVPEIQMAPPPVASPAYYQEPSMGAPGMVMPEETQPLNKKELALLKKEEILRLKEEEKLRKAEDKELKKMQKRGEVVLPEAAMGMPAEISMPAEFGMPEETQPLNKKELALLKKEEILRLKEEEKLRKAEDKELKKMQKRGEVVLPEAAMGIPAEISMPAEFGMPEEAPSLGRKELANLKKEEALRSKEEDKLRKAEEKELKKMQKRGEAIPPEAAMGIPSQPGLDLEDSAFPPEIEMPPMPTYQEPAEDLGARMPSMPRQTEYAPPVPPPAPAPEPLAPILQPGIPTGAVPPPLMPDFGDLATKQPAAPPPGIFEPLQPPSPVGPPPTEPPPPPPDLGMPEGFFD